MARRKKRAGILTILIILVLSVYAIAHIITLRGEISAAKEKKAELDMQVASLTAENDRLRYAVEHATEDSVIEDIARSEGYVSQDEEVYIGG